MKRRINAAIEEKVIRLAKERALEEGRSLSGLIQIALVQYLGTEKRRRGKRELAYHLFCETPMKIPPGQLQYIFADDM